jgi:hypothetical protein
LNSNLLQKGKDEIVQPHELVDGKNFFTSFDSNSHDTVDEKKFVNNADVDIVTEPTHIDVVGESIFTVSKNDKKLETREEVMKDNFTDAAVTQVLEEEIKSAQDLIANFNLVSDSIESPQKFFAVTFTPSPEKTVASTVDVAHRLHDTSSSVIPAVMIVEFVLWRRLLVMTSVFSTLAAKNTILVL